jgi:hypothetical protein
LHLREDEGMKKCVICGREFESAHDFDRHDCAGLAGPYRSESKTLRAIVSIAFLLAVTGGYVFLFQKYYSGGQIAGMPVSGTIAIAANVLLVAFWIFLFPARRLWLRVVIALAVWAVAALSVPGI